MCREIRDVLISTVTKTGGHLASNLGTVELTLAIHRVFDSPKDRILWDVGHQAYTHKLLTGRLDSFSTLRQEGGISGFPKPSESEHDAFICGHSSNSISAAFGIAEAMRLQGDTDHSVISVIGDGAITGGMAYEGLNNAGKSRDPIIIILNHNDMSISKNVGAVAKYLSNIRSSDEYLHTKNTVERVLDHTPLVGQPLKKAIKTSKSMLKGVLYHSTMFEDFGFVYLGPVDGHDQEALERVLSTAKKLRCPVLVHVNTVKGKGYGPAERNPGAFHGISRLDLPSGNPEVISEDSYSSVFGRELNRLASRDCRICAVTAAMKYGTGLQYFAADHRDRFFDVGIAEQHAVTFSAGLAQQGMLPVVAVYSSFLQRAYDQILHDAAICNTHLVLAIDRAGVVGEDGETHQGLFDVPFLTSIPNVVLYSPSCYEEVRMCLSEALFDADGVACVRYPRGKDASTFDKSHLNTRYTLSSGEQPSPILLITYGRIYQDVLQAAKALQGGGIPCDVLKLTKIFPLSQEVLNQVRKYRRIFFFEEGMERGGIGQHLAASLMSEGFFGQMEIIAVNGFVKQASVASILRQFHLDAVSIAEHIRKWWKDSGGKKEGVS